MPYPTEHAARMVDPGKFRNFRRENGKFGPGIDAIWGIDEAGKVSLQAVRFDASKHSPDEVRSWLESHDMKPIKVENAKPKKAAKPKTPPPPPPPDKDEDEDDGDPADESECDGMDECGPDGCEMKKKEFLPLICKARRDPEDPDDVLTCLMSTGEIDRQGEAVNPKTLDFGNYLTKNPVVQWAHDYTIPPIGKVIGKIDTSDGPEAKVKFATELKGPHGDFVRDVKALYDGGYLNAWSIGFIPGTKNKSGEPMREVVELSAVPVPANPNALTRRLKELAPDSRAMITKSLQTWGQQFIIDVKEGRVLSGKNRERVRAAVDQIQTMLQSLEDMLSEAEPSPTERADPMRDASEGPPVEQYFLDADGFVSKTTNGKVDPYSIEGKEIWILPDGRSLRKSAFSKSLAEAVTAGKIPTDLEIVPKSGMIFEIIKETEKEVTEVRVMRVIAAVQKTIEERPVKKDSPSPDDGRTRQAETNALRREAMALHARALKLSL